MAKIELEMKANTQGAVQNLKATQANINKVADAFVKLQNEGTNLSQMNNAVSGFYELVDRLATSMFTSGDAASYFEAKIKVMNEALKSAYQVKNGEFSDIADSLLNTASGAGQAAAAVTSLSEAESLLEDDTTDTTKALQKQGSKLLDVAKNILKFQLVMQPITSAIRTFKQTLSESIKVAAEAEQVYSKLGAVFDGMSSAPEKADALAKAIGTASSTAASALSTVGDLLQAQGMTVSESLEVATDWVEKFQDIIAFKDLNMSLEEFAQSFMSGAAGNLRNFRTFGSIVKESAVDARLAKEGLDKLTGTQLELAKMTTRATLALEQQENAYGATDREWESMLSIQRRMEEQSKRLEENLGEYLNTGLKPVKSAWTAILDSINKSIEAQKEFNRLTGGNGGGNKFFDWLRDGWERSFGASGSFAYDARQFGINSGLTADDTYSYDMTKSLVEVGRGIYGLDDERIREELLGLGKGKSINEGFLNRAFRALDLEAEFRAKDEERVATEEKLQSIYDALLENVNALTNVSVQSGDAPTVLSQLLSQGGAVIDSVFKQMEYTGSSKYADQLSVALGDDTEIDGLKAKQKEWASLYETARNFFIANNEDHELTKENIEILDKIKGKYQGINAQIQAIEDKRKADQAYLESVSKYQDMTGNYQLQYEQLGMTSAEKTLDDLTRALNGADKDSTLYTAISDAIDAFKLLQEKTELLARIEENMSKAQEMAEANMEKRNDLLSASADATADYRLQLHQLGMTDEEKTLDNFNTRLQEAADAMDKDLYRSIVNEKKAFVDLTEATKKLEEAEESKARIAAGWNNVRGNIYSNTGFIGDTINTFTDDQGNWVSDLVITVLKLFEQTEEFVQLIETLDSVLGPILIAFGSIADTLSEIMIPILDMILPIVKLVAKGFVAIATALELVWNTISGIIMNGIGHLTNAFYEMRKWFADFHIGWWYPFGGASSVQTPDWVSELANFDWMGANEDTLKKMDEWLAKIDANTLATAENTDKSDYKTYADLLRDKYITPDQYASLVGPNKYSSSTTMGSAIMTTGGSTNATYITINGLTLDTDIKDGQGVLQFLSENTRGVVAYK